MLGATSRKRVHSRHYINASSSPATHVPSGNSWLLISYSDQISFHVCSCKHTLCLPVSFGILIYIKDKALVPTTGQACIGGSGNWRSREAHG